MELIWIFAAFLAGMGAKLIRLPTMVGYLVAGLVLAYLGVQSTDFIQAVGAAQLLDAWVEEVLKRREDLVAS